MTLIQTEEEVLRFPRIEEFIQQVLSLDGEGLQRNFECEGHPNGRFHYNVLGRTTGNGGSHLVPEDNVILWDRFFPLEELGERAESLKRKGIGTLANITSCLYLTSLLGPQYKDYVIAHMGTSPERRKQLERIGINRNGIKLFTKTADFAEEFPSYLRKWINYANSRGFSFENPLGE